MHVSFHTDIRMMMACFDCCTFDLSDLTREVKKIAVERVSTLNY